jgi:hypothetical protein
MATNTMIQINEFKECLLPPARGHYPPGMTDFHLDSWWRAGWDRQAFRESETAKLKSDERTETI